MSYVTWSDATGRYKELLTINSAINPDSAYLGPAKIRVEGYLASHFATPFSDNNLTARDLTIDMMYLIAGNFKFKEREDQLKSLMARMDRLKYGDEHMLANDGTVIQTVGGTIASTTDGYHPVFGMGDIEDFAVDSQQVADENIDRGNYNG